VSRIDRIAEPWGTRTPYGPGEIWPVRVDSFLGDRLTEDDVDRWAGAAPGGSGSATTPGSVPSSEWAQAGTETPTPPRVWAP
jgi:hypothetical protein